MALGRGLSKRLSGLSVVYRLVHNAVLIHGADFAPPPILAPGSDVTHLTGGYEVDGYAELYAQHAPLMSDQALLEVETRQAWLYTRSSRSRFEQVLQSVMETLKALFDGIEATGATGLLVLIPDRFQVNSSDQQALLAQLGRSEQDSDWDLPQRRLSEELERHGIPYLDLLLPFREAAPARELYGRGDTHWSPDGCALAAQQMLGWFASRGDSLAER